MNLNLEFTKIVSVVLKVVSLGLVIAAGSFWAGAEVDTRPKYRDEQTLVGGAVWTQTIITIGLIISTIIDEELYVYVHGYFLIAGILLLITTGIILILGEWKAMLRRPPRLAITLPDMEPPPKYDKIYLVIGILSFLAGLATFADFIVVLI